MRVAIKDVTREISVVMVELSVWLWWWICKATHVIIFYRTMHTRSHK